MYLSFYGLKEAPFQISTNPRFLWLGEKHKEALASLRYGIHDNKGFLLLTGEVGTGKTTLINTLLASLGKDVIAVSVPDPGLKQLDFYYFIAAAFNIKAQFSSKGKFLVIFSRFLHEMHEKGKKVLLIIDEAQRMSPALLEEIRLLSNIEKPETKLINIFFVGQVEFNAILLREENRALRQRITVHYDISSLSLEETAIYLDHRLKIAGASRSLFTREAVQQIYLFSRGYPRLINVIADRSLLTGFVSEVSEVGPRIVLECARELKIPAPRLTAGRKAAAVKERLTAGGEVQAEETVEPDEDAATVTDPSNLEQQAGTESKPAAGRHNAASTPVVRRKDRKSVFLPVFLALIVLLAASAGAALFFSPVQSRQIIADARYKVLSLVKRQPWLPLHGTGERVIPGSGTTKSDSIPPLPPGPDSAKPGATQPAADGAEEESPPEKRGAAVTAPAAVEEEEARGDDAVGTKADDEEGSLATDEQSRENESRQDEKAAGEEDFSGPPVIIGFGHNSNSLTVYGAAVLDRLAERLRGRPYSLVVIRGYSDALGGKSYNKNISLFRAGIVRSYLMAKGINPDTIVALGLGAEKPIGSNETVEGRRKNRRVEIEVRP